MNEWFNCDYKSTPKAGETVYIIFEGEIYKEKIYAVGEDFFIPQGYRTYKYCLTEIKFADYGKKWFYRFPAAKDKLLEDLSEEEEIVQGDENWWYTSKI